MKRYIEYRHEDSPPFTYMFHDGNGSVVNITFRIDPYYNGGVFLKLPSETTYKKFPFSFNGKHIPTELIFGKPLFGIEFFVFHRKKTKDICIVEIVDVPRSYTERKPHAIHDDAIHEFLCKTDAQFQRNPALYRNIFVNYLEEWGITLARTADNYNAAKVVIDYMLPINFEVDGVLWGTLNAWYVGHLPSWDIFLHDTVENEQ